MNPAHFTVAVPDAQLGKQLGNAMSVNVLERVFVNALPAAGLINQSYLVDRWKSGDALVALKKTKDCKLQNRPDDAPERTRTKRRLLIFGADSKKRRLIVGGG